MWQRRLGVEETWRRWEERAGVTRLQNVGLQWRIVGHSYKLEDISVELRGKSTLFETRKCQRDALRWDISLVKRGKKSGTRFVCQPAKSEDESKRRQLYLFILDPIGSLDSFAVQRKEILYVYPDERICMWALSVAIASITSLNDCGMITYRFI